MPFAAYIGVEEAVIVATVMIARFIFTRF